MKSIGKQSFIVLFATLVAVGVIGVHKAQATVTLESLPDNKSYNDFVVGPGKTELELDPGETRTVNLSVANRLGTDKTFALKVEDFTGSDDPAQAIVLLGDDHGPYSLRDFIHPATSSIMIPQGKRARISVTISIPADAQPGGLYGSVIVGTETGVAGHTPDGGAIPQSPIITRIGTLFFVRVKGVATTGGELTKFSLAGGSFLWDSAPVNFDLVFKNEGNVHLDPSGTITVANMLGANVGTIDVEPWFAMPNSIRFREVNWAPPFLFGRYVAHASIKRGYASTTDEVDLVFWAIPWKIILSVLIGLIVIIAFIRWVFSKFTIVTKRK